MSDIAEVPKRIDPRHAKLARERGVLGKYVRAALRKLVDPPSGKPVPIELGYLRVLSDTDLAGIFIATSIKCRAESSIYRDFHPKIPGVPHKDILKAIRALRIETASLVGALKASKNVRENPALRKALKDSQKQLHKLSEKTDAYAELQWALGQQREKLEALIRREAVSKFRKDLSKPAMELFVKTAKDIVELEMKLGVRDMVPDEVNVKVHQSVSGHITHRVEPLGKNRMLEATRTFTKLLDTPVFDAEYEEVGEGSSE